MAEPKKHQSSGCRADWRLQVRMSSRNIKLKNYRCLRQVKGNVVKVEACGICIGMSRFHTSRMPGAGKARRDLKWPFTRDMSLSGVSLKSDTVLG